MHLNVAPGAGGMGLSPTVKTSDVRASVSKKSDWGSGYDGQFSIENKNAYDVLNWTMTFECPEEFTWFSDGDISRSGTTVKMVPKDYNRVIKAGETKTLGFGGVKAVPSDIKFEQILPMVGDDPAEKTRGDWGSKNIAPYVDACAFPVPSLSEYSKKSGLKYFTLAFVTADRDGDPSWGGTTPLDTQFMLDQIRGVRAGGGDVSISFGGANGTELAVAIGDVDALVDAYSEVIDLYTLRQMDMDVEGGAVADAESVDRRNKALAILAAKYPDLKISYCLPVLPTGLTADGVALVKNAKANKVPIDTWRCMSMDFGDSAAPDPEGRMGDYVIQSAKATRAQVEAAGYKNPKIGVIPMIGVNDVESEVFRLDDAAEVRDFFNATPWMSYLGFWSVNRDRPGSHGAGPSDSGISQNPYDFSKTFASAEPKPAPAKPKPAPKKAPAKPGAPGPSSGGPSSGGPSSGGPSSGGPSGKRLDPHPNPPTPAPIAHPVDAKMFAPYAESWLDKWNGVSLDKVPGARAFTFAFCLSNRGKPSFDGTMPIDRFLRETKAIRAAGGDVRISFGGATGRELATDVQDEKALLVAYKSVVDLYKCRCLDFDIEGPAITDVKTNSRRNRVLKKLQDAYPDLKIDFTVAVMPSGLPREVLTMLRDASSAGVRINSVNIMAMNYFNDPKDDMGALSVSAARSTKKQLDAAKIGAGVGITPMIGKNDTNEIFTLNDAETIVDFANSTSWVNFLGFWAVGRDNSAGTKLDIQPFDFIRAFSKFSK